MYSKNDYRYYELYHHGIRGQKWYLRRFQNPDGSLTAAGRERYGSGKGKKNGNSSRQVSNARKAIDGIHNGTVSIDDPIERIKVVTADCRNVSYPKNNDPKEVARVNKAADLGLKALSKIRGEDFDNTDEFADYYMNERGMSKEKALKMAHQSNRDWFLYEDQTIGLPMIADLINQGYSASQVSKMIDIVNKAYDDADYDRINQMPINAQQAAFNIYESSFDNENTAFAKACEEIKNSRN